MKPAILLQLDVDDAPSVFDAVVAVDSGVSHLLQYGKIRPEQVRDLVHGLLFTRGPADLNRSAVFIGGSDAKAAEAVAEAVTAAFFGPFRVSTLLDPNGANTTAAAAVLAARAGIGGDLSGVSTAVLGATGPVGGRVARLLAREGAEVAVGSRSLERAKAAAEAVESASGKVARPFMTEGLDASPDVLRGVALVVSAGAPGATLLSAASRSRFPDLKVVIDLNAVPPAGIEGVEPDDRGADRDGQKAWGALGVGGTKMKIHRRALEALFEANDWTLDAEAVLEIGKSLAPS